MGRKAQCGPCLICMKASFPRQSLWRVLPGTEEGCVGTTGAPHCTPGQCKVARGQAARARGQLCPSPMEPLSSQALLFFFFFLFLKEKPNRSFSWISKFPTA